jgi:hypothetical protein
MDKPQKVLSNETAMFQPRSGKFFITSILVVLVLIIACRFTDGKINSMLANLAVIIPIYIGTYSSYDLYMPVMFTRCGIFFSS